MHQKENDAPRTSWPPTHSHLGSVREHLCRQEYPHSCHSQGLWILCGGSGMHHTLLQGAGAPRANEVSLNITPVPESRAPCPQVPPVICRQLGPDVPLSAFGVVFNGCSGWDLSSWEAFGLSHVSLEELEKQVWSSWPRREPHAWVCRGAGSAGLGNAATSCLPGTALCPGDSSVSARWLLGQGTALCPGDSSVSRDWV